MKKKRKLIAVLAIYLENSYQTRVMEGIFAQCQRYDYDVAVFAPLVQSIHSDKEYLSGEWNIYSLINFDKFDGVIVTALPMHANGNAPIYHKLVEMVKKKCHKKVVSIDLPFDGSETAYTNDRKAFYEITEHVYDVHHCRNVYFLNGFPDQDVCKERLSGYRDYLSDHDLPFDESKVFDGDFWYDSGEQLAERISSGGLAVPDAVICASDHMAVGLMNRLILHGIKVPEQVVVTGYDATKESVINETTLTTYEPANAVTAEEAVNLLHAAIDEEEPEIEPVHTVNTNLRPGDSCGCHCNPEYLQNRIRRSLYNVNSYIKAMQKDAGADISELLDGYLFENLVSVNGSGRCIYEIYKNTHILRPYKDFYMCLREDWMDTNTSMIDGYPERMRMVLHSELATNWEDTQGVCFTPNDPAGERSFYTEEMLPEMFEEREEGTVFYFSPVHFAEQTLGYAVLTAGLSQQRKLDYVFHNWLRNVNNALEMMRVRGKIETKSEIDAMTGLYNRRAMENKLEGIRQFGKGKILLTLVADLDRLKYINDTFGHHEGDYAIKSLAAALAECKTSNEICIRSGGDEFILLGVDEYTEDDVDEKVARIESLCAKKGEEAKKSYEVSVSIGYCLARLREDTNVDLLIEVSDQRMYEVKREHHKMRAS
ncbi:MAG: GGDEF domain-containing protein [Lachnospiraceae bacterium]|nr:GGDEF domain-containing protein [Lachnospiraceae bacterium]